MKSQVISTLLNTVAEVYIDVCNMCAAEPHKRDLETIRSRVKHEGLSFLTITLPQFGTDFESALDCGFIDSRHFRSFRKCRGIPAFLQGILSHVFDPVTGRLCDELDEFSHAAVAGVRQLAFVCKKLRIRCSPARERAAIGDYKSSEQDISDQALSDDKIQNFDSVCRLLWSSAFGDFNPFDTIPRHGPGAVAERWSANRRYSAIRWHDRLEMYFPLCSFAFPNENAIESKGFQDASTCSSEEEQPVRVVFVPKTLKSPRVIAIEPACMQYTQQALSSFIIRKLETFDLTAGHINFTDQTVNQKLALSSSMDGKYCTIDLSSASDRVPNHLVLRMFASNPILRDSIQACRSTKAQLPDGEILSLLKFASMGSALCFPIESMYFYTLCVIALLKERGLSHSYRNIRKVCSDIFVYGDDIIVPTKAAAIVIETLQEYYCKVNRKKTFFTGKFRESCGLDAFDGTPVQPTYLRELPPSNKRDAKALISWTASCNQLYLAGYWRASDYLRKEVERIIGKLPIIKSTSEAIGLVSYQNVVSTDRWNRQLHRTEIRAYVARPIYRSDALDGYPALLKCLLSLERRSSSDVESMVDHLERTARHGAAALKRRWVSPM